MSRRLCWIGWFVAGLGLVAGCASTSNQAESQPAEAPLSSTDNETGFGPLAVHAYSPSGDEALISGQLLFTDSCVLLTSAGVSTLLLWPNDATSFDPASRTVTYQPEEGQVIELRDGDAVAFGGGHTSADQDGQSAEDFLGAINWVNRPAAGCVTEIRWFVGAVVESDQGDQSEGGHRPVGLAHTGFLGADGRSLEIEVASCNGDPTAEVIEDEEAVTIFVESFIPAGDEFDACADVLTVVLAAELEERRVIDGLTGQVIEVIGRCPMIRGIGQDASEFLGLVQDQAEAQASEAGLTLLVECRDGVAIPPLRPTNIDHSRLWISIDRGVVTSSYRL